MMSWDELMQRLAADKREGISGLSAAAIANLIFVGACDSFIPEGKPKNSTTYMEMYRQALKALKSKAKLPPPTKTMPIGLENVVTSGETALIMWRLAVNPLATFDFIKPAEKLLKEQGFEKYTHSRVYMMRKKRFEPDVWLSDHWSIFFDNKELFQLLSTNKRLGIVGMITQSSLKKYSNGEKERIVFKLFSGKEYTDEIVAWPNRRTGEVSAMLKSALKVQAVGLAILKLTKYKGQPGAYLDDWKALSL